MKTAKPGFLFRLSTDIIDVESMFTVDSLDAERSRWQQCVKARHVSAVNNVGLELRQELQQAPAQPPHADSGSMHGIDLDIVALDPLLEIREIFYANHCVPKSISGQVVDQVDETILQATGVQVMDHMDDEDRDFRHRQKITKMWPSACHLEPRNTGNF